MGKLRRPVIAFVIVAFSCFLAAADFLAGEEPEKPAPQPKPPFEIDQDEIDANRIQPPVQVLDASGVRSGMAVGEVGAGRGRFTVYLANRVGSCGKVYANDIDRQALDFLRERCARQGFKNVVTILGETDNPLLPNNGLDLVFLVWVYHHLEHPVALLKNLVSSLKPGGMVVIVDPDPVKNKGGRPTESRSPVRIEREVREAGFELVRVETFLKTDNIFILRPRPVLAKKSKS